MFRNLQSLILKKLLMTSDEKSVFQNLKQFSEIKFERIIKLKGNVINIEIT